MRPDLVVILSPSTQLIWDPRIGWAIPSKINSGKSLRWYFIPHASISHRVLGRCLWNGKSSDRWFNADADWKPIGLHPNWVNASTHKPQKATTNPYWGGAKRLLGKRWHRTLWLCQWARLASRIHHDRRQSSQGKLMEACPYMLTAVL